MGKSCWDCGGYLGRGYEKGDPGACTCHECEDCEHLRQQLDQARAQVAELTRLMVWWFDKGDAYEFDNVCGPEVEAIVKVVEEEKQRLTPRDR